MRFDKSFTRSIACLSFSLLFLIAAFARPALAQSDDDASPDSKTAVSELSVSPTALSYSVNLGKAATESKHFTLTNTGTLDLDATVNAPAGTDAGDYTISGPGLTASGGTIPIPGKVNSSKANIIEVNVAFTPPEAGKKLDATILVTNTGTKGKRSDTIKLAGSAKGTPSTPTPGFFTCLSATMTSPRALFTATLLPDGVPRQHKLDSLQRLRKRGFLAHLNPKRSGDEIESRYAFGGSGKGSTGHSPGDSAAVLSGGEGPDRDCRTARRGQRR